MFGKKREQVGTGLHRRTPLRVGMSAPISESAYFHVFHYEPTHKTKTLHQRNAGGNGFLLTP
jgi:hypothetical protein